MALILLTWWKFASSVLCLLYSVFCLCFFFWTMLRSSSQQWQSWSHAKIVIVGQPNPKERSGTDNTKQTTTNTPKQHQTKATIRSLTNRWKCETRWNRLTLSLHQKSPALTTSSASCSNDVNAQALCSNRHCPLQPAPLLYPGIPHIFIQSNSEEHMGDLAGNYSCFHELIIQRSIQALQLPGMKRCATIPEAPHC